MTVYLSLQLGGHSEWFAGGWSGNRYADATALELRGPRSGWFLADGRTEVGVGNYR